MAVKANKVTKKRIIFSPFLYKCYLFLYYTRISLVRKGRIMKYYFCGIGGIGMSSIAKYYAFKGAKVAGSDRGFDLSDNMDMKQSLLDAGIELFPQDGSGVTKDTDCFVTSTAVEADIPDVKKALELNIPIRKRAEMLAIILNQYTGIAVGGTSGKTTISAMIGHILQMCGKSPTIINGGILLNTYQPNAKPSNLILGNGEFCVIESDESDGTIELYKPAVSVVSNISLDHKPLAELRTLFADFIQRTEKGTILNFDCDETRNLAGIHPVTVMFSTNPESGADFIATDITPTREGISFMVNGEMAHLIVPGKHNVENALAAIGAVHLVGIKLEDALEALTTFKGTKRRLEKIGTVKDINVFDDYAHNPEKVAASLKTLSHPGHRL